MTTISDEKLMAFADNALPPDEAAAVVALIAADPHMLEKVEMYRSSRRIVAEAMQPLAAEPVPPALQDAVLAMIAKSEAEASRQPADNVVPFRARPPQAPAQSHWSMRIAASVAVLAAAIGGYAIGVGSSSTEPASNVAVGAELPEALAAMLATQPSGTEAQIEGAMLKMIATVRTPDGTLCREFEIDSLANKQTSMGVACRADQSWRLDIAVAAPADDGGFAPASSQTALSSYLDAIGASDALDAAQEKDALR